LITTRQSSGTVESTPARRASPASEEADEVAVRLGRVEGLGTGRARENAVRKVVLQVAADPGQLVDDVDAGGLEHVARADTREKKQMR